VPKTRVEPFSLRNYAYVASTDSLDLVYLPGFPSLKVPRVPDCESFNNLAPSYWRDAIEDQDPNQARAILCCDFNEADNDDPDDNYIPVWGIRIDLGGLMTLTQCQNIHGCQISLHSEVRTQRVRRSFLNKTPISCNYYQILVSTSILLWKVTASAISICDQHPQRTSVVQYPI
jgi:hypothetical protein